MTSLPGAGGGHTDRLTDREMWFDGRRYRVAIQTRERRGRPQYRWVLQREFVGWRDQRTGLWTRSFDRAVRRGERVLNKHDDYRYEEVGRV